MASKHNVHEKELRFCSVYFVCWIASSIISVASLIVSSQSLKYSEELRAYLEPGWSLLATHKDSSDLEWADFKRALFYDLRWWFIGHVVINLILSTLSSIGFCRKVIFTLYGLVYAAYILDLPCTCLMIIEIATMFVAAKVVTTTFFMWFMSFAWIAIVQCFLNSSFVEMDDYYRSLQFSSLAYTILRSIYFAKNIIKTRSENVKEDITKSGSKVLENIGHISFLDCLNYCLYMPLLSFGQLVVFEEFKDQDI